MLNSLGLTSPCKSLCGFGLILCPFNPGLLAINGDEEVTRFLPYPTWQSIEDGQAWFERSNALCAQGAALQFVIVEKASACLIETSLIFRYEAASARAEMGYVLGRAYWGKGLMREALSALVSCAFMVCGMRRLEAEVSTGNLPSNRLLLRLGFVHEGLLRQRWAAKGKTYDVNFYGLLRGEWLEGGMTHAPTA